MDQLSPSLVTFLNSLILISLAVGLPFLVVGILSIFNIKKSKNFQIYLYAFTSGLIIILGTVGLLGEGILTAKEALSTTSLSPVVQTLEIIGVILGGCIIGVGLVIFSRLIFTKFLNKKEDLHHNHFEHNHQEFLFNPSDIDNKNIKWIPIILLLLHRLLDGIVLGFLANTTTQSSLANFANWGMIIVFIIHLLPTTIIIYFVLLDIFNFKRLKAFLFSLIFIISIIPFVIIGSFFINGINSVWWLLPFLYSISGVTTLLTSILEIIPEFIHYRNASLKKWILITCTMAGGALLSILLILIHSH